MRIRLRQSWLYLFIDVDRWIDRSIDLDLYNGIPRAGGPGPSRQAPPPPFRPSKRKVTSLYLGGNLVRSIDEGSPPPPWLETFEIYQASIFGGKTVNIWATGHGFGQLNIICPSPLLSEFHAALVRGKKIQARSLSRPPPPPPRISCSRMVIIIIIKMILMIDHTVLSLIVEIWDFCISVNKIHGKLWGDDIINSLICIYSYRLFRKSFNEDNGNSKFHILFCIWFTTNFHCSVLKKIPFLYAVKVQRSLAPLSWFPGSRKPTAHVHQCCRFQSYAKSRRLHAIVN